MSVGAEVEKRKC